MAGRRGRLTRRRIAAELFQIVSEESLDARETQMGQSRTCIQQFHDALRNVSGNMITGSRTDKGKVLLSP